MLKVCAKEKSPGSDRWGVELFLQFKELMIPNLLVVIEESRTQGFILGSIDATFIALIPKKEKSESFVDYRLISLCKSVYKMI